MCVQKNAEDKHDYGFDPKPGERSAIHTADATVLIVCFHKLRQMIANRISHKANSISLGPLLSTVFQHIVPRGTLDQNVLHYFLWRRT
jgi:hypothetical protein